ncbi:YceI family protein [Nocardia sp. NPDC051030]|uniref:YceI family protein n=1 Tax=Nocardia sp. NPDC051030 TaxID=3155162 RepID=UPI00341DF0E8
MARNSQRGRIRSALRNPITWLVVGLLIAAVGVGGPYIYLHMVSANNPDELSFNDLASLSSGPTRTTTMPAEVSTVEPTTISVVAPAPAPGSAPAVSQTPPEQAAPPPPVTTVAAPTTTTTDAPGSPIAGTWTVGNGTDARWSTDDTLLGQTTRVVGRTSDVSGTIRIDGLTITSARITVNMQTATCGCMHDAAYSEMLETGKFPTSNFVLTEPIVFPSVPQAGAVVSVPANGQFTIHGVTRSVSFEFETTEVGGRIAFKAYIPVDPGDFAIQPPVSNNPMGSIGNTAIELLIAFDRTG